MEVSPPLKSQPLRDAISSNDPDHVRGLLESLVLSIADEADSDGRTSLHMACSSSKTNPEIISLLLNKGCNFMTKDAEGYSPLHSTASCGNFPAARLLLAKWIPEHEQIAPRRRKLEGINSRTISQKSSPLHFAASKGHNDIIKELIQAGAYVDAKDAYGITPLMRAAGRGWVVCMDTLINTGNADVKAIDNQGNNVLHVACEADEQEACKYLWSSPLAEDLRKVRNNDEKLPIELASDSLRRLLRS
mmetsp:Transcript_7140/g.12833  ORF Transcript_7140/g.12833 Transcript_7140/m.12833 type:complete len:247 (-) Transcript_7140:42-782(-)